MEQLTCSNCEEVAARKYLREHNGLCEHCFALTQAPPEDMCQICGKDLTEEELELKHCKDCLGALDREADKVEKLQELTDGDVDETDIELTEQDKKTIAQYKKHQQYMQEYNQKPHVKAKRQQYNKDRAKRQAEAVRRLKEEGKL